MKTNRRIVFLALIIGCVFFAACAGIEATDKGKNIKSDQTAQSTPLSTNRFSMPEGWIVYPKPSPESAQYLCANHSRKEWKVESDGEKIKISEYSYREDEQIAKLPPKLRAVISKNRNIGQGLGGYLHIEPFENGWLIGSDAGEWGGKLFWLSDDGTQKKELLNDNVRGIAKTGSRVLILSGMAHLSLDDGKIYKLVKDEKENLKTQLLFDLKTQPQTFTVQRDDSILITLNDRIIRLDSSAEKIETLKEIEFSGLYPNSMTVASDGAIYIGMRLFIVRLVPHENSYTEEWLVEKNCRKFELKNYDCVCQKE